MLFRSVRIHCPDTASTIAYARQLAQSIRQWEPQPQTESDENNVQKGGNKPNTNKGRRKGHAAGAQEGHESGAVHSGSAPQSKQNPISACASQTQQPTAPSRAKDQLAALFHAEAQDLPQALGDILSGALTRCQAESAYETVTVAVEGFRPSEALPEAQKQQALKASIALRTRLQGLLQAQTQKRCSIGRRGEIGRASCRERV